MAKTPNAFSRITTRHFDLGDMAIPVAWGERAVAQRSGDPHRSRPGFAHAETHIGQSSSDRSLVLAVEAMIDAAQETVVVCSFLFSDPDICEALLRAAKRGVRGYVMLAAETRLKSEPPEDDASDWGAEQRRRLDEFKRMLNSLAGWVVVRAADCFHAKFVLTDPRSRPAGILLTCNLTKEALTRNEEIAVRLEKTEVHDLFALARWAFWEQAGHEALEPGRLESCSPLGEVDHPRIASSLLCTTEQSQAIRARWLEIIEAETRRIVVCSYGFDDSHQVIDALARKVQQGVRVTVLARPRRAAMPALVRLAEAGATVLGFRWLHAKALWTESSGAVVASANLEPHGLDDGFEVGVSLSDARADDLGRLLGQWTEAAPWQLHISARRRDLVGPVQVWDEDRRDINEATVIAEHAETVSMTAESIELIADVEPETEPPADGVVIGTDGRTTMPCAWAYHFTIGPPFLHPKAKKQPTRGTRAAGDGSGGPELFREPDGTIVVAISSESQVPAAIALRQEAGARRIVLIGAQ